MGSQNPFVEIHFLDLMDFLRDHPNVAHTKFEDGLMLIPIRRGTKVEGLRTERLQYIYFWSRPKKVDP